MAEENDFIDTHQKEFLCLTQSKNKKKAVLFCTCSGACTSMAKLDFWALAERVRLELEDDIEFLALHPHLCEPDGERLKGQILSDDIFFITSACSENKQKKLLRTANLF